MSCAFSSERGNRRDTTRGNMQAQRRHGPTWRGIDFRGREPLPTCLVTPGKNDTRHLLPRFEPFHSLQYFCNTNTSLACITNDYKYNHHVHVNVVQAPKRFFGQQASVQRFRRDKHTWEAAGTWSKLCRTSFRSLTVLQDLTVSTRFRA